MSATLRITGTLGIIAAVALLVGCSSTERPAKQSVEPSYSYLQDRAYLDNPEAWELYPSLKGSAVSEASPDQLLVVRPSAQ